VVHFKEVRDYFISAENLVDLSEESRTVMGKVPKQLGNTTLAQSISGISDSIAVGMKGTLVISIFANLILAGVLGKFIGAIRVF
jgi:hypothetical protein